MSSHPYYLSRYVAAEPLLRKIIRPTILTDTFDFYLSPEKNTYIND